MHPLVGPFDAVPPAYPRALSTPFRVDKRVPLKTLPLRAKGRHVVNNAGDPVQLFCVNWYGAHLARMVLTGLDVRPARDIAKSIWQLGFNCVRLSFSLDMVFGNATRVPDAETSLAANPKLKTLSPWQVFDHVLADVTSEGLLVVLNNHVSKGGWCCGFNDDEGLWYNEAYPQKLWFESVSVMSSRYANDDRVVGLDLRNELRPSSLGVPSWGNGDPATDWSIASAKASEIIIKENPKMLIIVSGMLYCMFLCGVPKNPLHLASPELHDRVVYTAHEYSMTSIHLEFRRVLGKVAEYLGCVQVLAWLILLALKVPCCVNSSSILPVEDSLSGEAVGRGKCWGRRRLFVAFAKICLPVFGFGLLVTAVIAVGSIYVPVCAFTSQISSVLVFVGIFVMALLSTLLWLRLVVQGCVAVIPRRRSTTVESEPRCQDVDDESPPSPRCAPYARGDGSPRTPRGRPYPARNLLKAIAVTIATTLAFCAVRQWAGTYETFQAELDSRWGFLVSGAFQNADPAQTAPVWIGEFGTAANTLWWSHVTRYFSEREVGWAYWSINGDPDHPYMAVLREDSVTVRHDWKLHDLQKLINQTWTGGT